MKSKHIGVFVLHLVIAITLMVIWFKPGYIYGGGDVGLPTYNPIRILDVVKNVWWEASAPGFPRPQGVTAVPSYSVLALGQKLGLSEVAIQASLYGLLVLMMFQGIYWLTWEIFGENSYLSLLASFVYVFHPNLMIQVWHRFVQTAFYFAAALPFLLIFWQRWILEAKRRYLLIFLMISIFSASIFSTLGYLITFWIILGLQFVVLVFVPWKNKQNLFIFSKRFAIGLLSWLAVSLWWLGPIFIAIPAAASAQHSIGESVSNLLTLSGQTIAPYTLQGINPYYLFYEKDWGEIYSSLIFLIIPWLGTAAGLWGVWQALKNKKTVYWGLLLIVGIAIAKGAAAPFGNLFTFIFNKFFILGVLRNPFEKVGIIIPLAYAIVLPLGLMRLLTDIKRRKIRRLALCLFILTIVSQIFVWDWPFWTGKMFGTAKQPAYVKVPDSYAEVDAWLNAKANGGRILHLPLTSTEAISYKWTQGYSGAEPSQLLFASMPSWSQGFNLPYLDDLTKTVQVYLRDLTPDKIPGFASILEKMNIKYIVLHMDVLPNDADVDNPGFVRSAIETLPFLKLVHHDGDLFVYQVGQADKPSTEIDFSSNLTSIHLGEDNKYWPWLAKPVDSTFVGQVGSDINSDKNYPADFIVADRVFPSAYRPGTDMASLLTKLPPVKILPSSKLYPLISLKEQIETPWIPNGKQAIVELNFAGKRLVEAVKLVDIGNLTYLPNVLTRYQTLIDYLFTIVNTTLPYDRPTVVGVFVSHLQILELLEQKITDPNYSRLIAQTKDHLKNNLTKYEILPEFDQIENRDTASSLVYGFTTLQDQYRVLVPINNLAPVPENISMQVDIKQVNATKKKQGDFWDIGEVNLVSGYHEIRFSLPDEQLPIGSDLTLTSQTHDATTKNISLLPLVNGSYYTLNFEYWVQKGNGFSIQLDQDSDVVDKNGKLRRAESFFGIDNYNRYWRQASVSFKIRDTTRVAYIKIQADPWDDCKIIIAKKDLCLNESFKRSFQRPTQVIIRSLSLARKTELPIFLQSESMKPDTATTNAGVVNYQKHPDNIYQGSFYASQSGMLFLRQTFDPGWKIKLTNMSGSLPSPSKYLVDYYANGWRIDQPGQYKFEIYYSPQQDVNKGLLIGLALLTGMLILPKKWYEKTDA